MNSTHRPLRAVAAIVAIGTIAALVPTTIGPSSATAAPPPPCGPLGTLSTYVLNDRCDFGSMEDPETLGAKAVVAGLQAAGLFAMSQECRGGALVPVVARPDELLVTADSRGLLDEAIVKVQSLLGPGFESTAKVNALAATVHLQPGTLDRAFLEHEVPTLQGPTWSTDLNYLEPALPNNSFRPADNPDTAPPAATGIGGKGSVLVLDSPVDRRRLPPLGLGVTVAGPSVNYDVDGNTFIDEDHGHGVFVATLIKRLAPLADVTLYGVNGGHIPGSARWSPMMFSDADLIAAMGTAFGLSGTGTSTRRSFDVVNLSLGGASCGGVAARLGLGRFIRDLAVAAIGRPPMYVAAAGNDGLDVAHLPAAFRDTKTMEAAAQRIDAEVGQSPSAEGDAVRKIGTDLAARSIAVGSWTAGVRDGFSNCGDWVNGIADGAGAISRYPSATGWASWSGTSFATPQVSAAVVHGKTSGVVVKDAVGTC